MLEIDELTTEFHSQRGVVHAVNGVSFQVRGGEIVGLVGESGCGKSATVRSINRLIQPPGHVTGGRVLFRGRDLVQLKQRELRRIRGAEIGFVGQAPFAALNPVLTIEAQFANVIRAHRRGASRASIRELALRKLRETGLHGAERVLDGYAHELSGGMAQRVVIAMASALEPKLLIADEPTTALDVTVQRQILDLIQSLVRVGDRAMLLVTHDLGVVAQYCDWVVVMYAGKVVEQGRVADVFAAPAHPYTAALLKAVPRPGQQLVGLRGTVPDLIRYPTGCPYRERCPLAHDRCVAEEPFMRSAGGRDVSCHTPLNDEASQLAAALR